MAARPPALAARASGTERLNIIVAIALESTELVVTPAGSAAAPTLVATSSL
jgi:hypothetical protein